MKSTNQQDDSKKQQTSKHRTDAEKENIIVKVQAFTEKYSKKILIISGSVIGAVVIIFLVKYFIDNAAEKEHAEASIKIDRIMQYYTSGDYQKALYGDSTKKINNEDVIGLIAIADKYSSINEGKRAALYAAHSLEINGNYEEAKKYYEMAAESDSKVMREGATVGIAACKEALNDIEGALKEYEKAIEIAEIPTQKSRYQYFAALLYEKKGDKEKAGNLYKSIINDYIIVDNNSDIKSEFIQFAKNGLARLGMEIE